MIGNIKNNSVRRMNLIAPLVYQGAMISLEYELDSDATELNLYALQGENKLEVPFKKSVDEPGKWTGMLKIPDDAALGEYTYQFWSTVTVGDDTNKKLETTGTFSIAAGFASAEAIEKSPNEKRLDAVQKAIDNLMSTGIAAYGISGSYTTRLSLNHLNAEKFRLQNLINIERRNKGLPYLQGTLAKHYTQFIQG